MSRTRLAILFLAFLLIVLAWWQVGTARGGLVVRQLNAQGLPAMFLAPDGAVNTPGVLIAHGFSGSKQLMLGYAFVLAHAGYGALVWDFNGHGANPNPISDDSLQANIDSAYQLLNAQPEIDPTRTALLGHSMGSGAVMRAGINDVARYAAVVAISPTGADVTPSTPRNLLLQAGSLETPFRANAESLLQRAGGENLDLASGLARHFETIPWAEHVSILFRPLSHDLSVRWVSGTFALDSVQNYQDRRIVWYGLHLLGWLLIMVTLTPIIQRRVQHGSENRADRLIWLGMFTGPIVASVVLALANRLVDVSELGGILVGAALAGWFLVAGLTWLLVGGLGPNWSATSVWPIRTRSWAGAAFIFLVLFIAFGLMAQSVWLQWWLILPRLLRWPFLSLGLLPWFLAAGLAQSGSRAKKRLLWWLLQCVAIVVALLIAVIWVPGLLFLALLIPLIPLIFAMFAVVGSAVDDPWAYALGSSAFFGWLIAAIFPLAGG